MIKMINYGHLLPLRLTCQFSNPRSKHKAKILRLLMNGWQWMSFYCIPDAQGALSALCAVIGGLLDYFFLVCPKCNIFIKKDNVVLLPRSQKCNFSKA